MFTVVVGGALAAIFSAIIESIISIVCGFIACIMAVVAYLFLKAMSIGPLGLQEILGASLTSGTIAQNITLLGLGIAMIFALSEIIKSLMSVISGENRITSPGTILVRTLVFGAWAIAGIPIAETIFQAVHVIYNAMLNMAFPGAGLTNLVSGILQLFTMSGNLISSDISSGLSSVPDWALSCVSLIVGTLLLIFTLWNFLKLLLESATRFGALIFYVYLCPLAIGCGASPTWSKITWAWFKTFLSTLALWVLNIWCVYGGLQVLNVGIVAGTDFLAWSFLAYGYMKAAQQVDNILNQIGCSVTRSSGSLLGDMREMAYASMAASRTSGKVSNMAQAGQAALTHGKGMGPGSEKLNNIGMDKRNSAGTTNRSGLQVAKDVGAAVMGQTAIGKAVNGVRNTTSGVSSALSSAKGEVSTASRDNAAVGGAKKLSDIANKYSNAEIKDDNGNVLKPAGQLPRDEGKGVSPQEVAMHKAMASEQQQTMQELSAHGATNLEGNTAVQDHLSNTTAFDPNDLSKGSMADNGYKCESNKQGQGGMISGDFVKRDENGNILGKQHVDNIGVGTSTAEGRINSGENKSINGMAAGKPTAPNTASGITSGYQISQSPFENSATVSKQSPDGKTSAQRITPIAKNDDGTQAYRVDTLNASGRVSESGIITGAAKSSINDIANDVGAGTTTSFAKDKKGELIGYQEPRAVGNSAITTPAPMTPSYMSSMPNVSSNDENTAPPPRASVSGEAFGAEASKQYAFSAAPSPIDASRTNVALSEVKDDGTDGNVVMSASVSSADYSNALSNQGSLNDFAAHLNTNSQNNGTSMNNGSSLGAMHDYSAPYDITPNTDAPVQSTSTPSAQYAETPVFDNSGSQIYTERLIPDTSSAQSSDYSAPKLPDSNESLKADAKHSDFVLIDEQIDYLNSEISQREQESRDTEENEKPNKNNNDKSNGKNNRRNKR